MGEENKQTVATPLYFTQRSLQMTDIILNRENLPANIEDLSRFVLIGREKLAAVKAEIRAIDKVGLAGEVYEQKLQEAQALAEALLDAEVRVGELMKQVPKASGRPKKIIEPAFENFDEQDVETPLDSGWEFLEQEQPKTKAQVIEDAGFTQKQVEHFQIMADHPDIVEEAKAEARQNNNIVTRQNVLNKIKNKPHVAYNSGDNEWYTPAEYIALAREVLGTIDLDPASSDMANKVVQAETYYTTETDGLTYDWCGTVWMNPPYASNLIVKFVDKFCDCTDNIDSAIILVNNATETAWFKKLVSVSSAMCFPYERLKFYSPDGRIAQPLQGQVLLYFGDNAKKFTEVFKNKGWCAYPA